MSVRYSCLNFWIFKFVIGLLVVNIFSTGNDGLFLPISSVFDILRWWEKRLSGWGVDGTDFDGIDEVLPPLSITIFGFFIEKNFFNRNEILAAAFLAVNPKKIYTTTLDNLLCDSDSSKLSVSNDVSVSSPRGWVELESVLPKIIFGILFKRFDIGDIGDIGGIVFSILGKCDKIPFSLLKWWPECMSTAHSRQTTQD